MQKIIVLGFDSMIPKLAEQFIAEGRMPNLARLKEEGTWTEAIPTYPAVTPSGWATIGTGAWPSTHGIEGFRLHFEGETPDVGHDGFDSKFCRAQYFWEAAEAQGRQVILFKYPGTWPPRLQHGIQVGGNGGYGGRKNALDVTHACCFSTGSEPGGRSVSVVAAENWTNLPSDGAVYREVELPFVSGRGDVVKRYYALLILGDEARLRVRLTRSRDFEDLLAELRPHQWSQWIYDSFDLPEGVVKGAFRIKIIHVSPDGTEFKLYASQNLRLTGWTRPQELAEELVSQCGPLEEYTGPKDFWNGWYDLPTQWELYRSHTACLGRYMDYLLSHKPWDIFATQCHPIDYAQHIIWGGIDPGHPDFDSGQRDHYWRLLGDVYAMMDDLIGIGLRHQDAHTVVAVVGDHGHELYAKTLHLNNLLIREGLLVADRDSEGVFHVDWSRSRAFATGHVSVFINLRGREPEGIVSPGAEYRNLRERIINLLYEFRDEETGVHPVKFAVKTEEMRPWGLYGSGVGDVIYALKRGYDNGFGMQIEPGSTFIGITDDGQVLRATRLLRNYTSEHPDFSPHAKTVRTIFALSGPGVKRGFQPTLPTRLVDVAPTLAQLTGLPQPAQAEGMVVQQLLE